VSRTTDTKVLWILRAGTITVSHSWVSDDDFLCGWELREIPDICPLFNSEGEKYRPLLLFIEDSSECVDRAVHVSGPDQVSEHLKPTQ
jgi:hypothetical protein